MATTEDLLIKIQANTSDANAQIKSLNEQLIGLNATLKDTQKVNQKTEQSVTGFGASMVKVQAAVAVAEKAFQVMSGVFKNTIGDFIKGEDALIRLSGTLTRVGETDVKGVTKQFDEFSKMLMYTTMVQDDVALSLLNVAKAAGVSNQQAMQLVETAADLAATGRGDLNTAFNALLKSLKGSTGALAIMAPELANMTKESAMAGDAIRYLQGQLGGLAKNQLNETGAQIQKVFELTKELGGQFGEIVSKVLGFEGGVKDLRISLTQLVMFIEANKEEFIELGKAIVEVAKALALFVVWTQRALIIQQLTTAFTLLQVAIGANVVAIRAWIVAIAVASGGTLIGVLQVLAAEFMVMTKAVLANVVALGRFAIALAVPAAKIALIAAGITTLVVSIDLIIANFRNLGTLAVAAFQAVAIGAAIATEETLRFFGATKTADKVALGIDAIGEKFGKLALNLNGGVSGQVFDKINQYASSWKNAGDKAAEAGAKAEESGKKAGASFKIMTDEAKKTLEELEKKLIDLRKADRESGLDETGKIGVKIANQMIEIQGLEDKLRLNKALSAQAKAQIQEARELAASAGMKELAELQKKNLDEITQKNKEMFLEVNQGNMFTLDLIEKRKKLELELLQVKMDSLALDDAGKEALREQMRLVEQRAKQESAKAPTKEFESAAKPGKEVAESIQGALGGAISGAAGAIGGMMTGAGAVMGAVSGVLDFVQQIIDFIPQILNKIANIFNTLTELPLKILEGVQNIMKSIVKFTSEFIPNLLYAIPEILSSLVEGLLYEIPNAFIKLVEKLPDLMIKFFERIPEIVSRLVQGLIESSPRIAIALVEFLVKGVPRIAIALLKMIYIEIPKAIVEGIIKGIQSIGDLFSGKIKMPKLDEKQVVETMKKAARALTGEAGKIFAVMDLTDGPVQEATKNNIKAVEDAGKKARNWLLDAWKWIFEQFMKLIMFLRKVWLWVYDNVIKPIWKIVTAAWKWVYDNIVKPMVNILKTSWENIFNVAKTIFGGIVSLFMNVWNTLKAIWQTLMDMFSGKINILDGVRKLFDISFQYIANALRIVFETGSRLFRGAVEFLQSIFNQASQIGVNIWNGFKSAFEGAGSFLSSMGGKIWDGLAAGFNDAGKGLQKILNDLNPMNLLSKMFKFDGGGKGGVEEALSRISGSNIDVPFVAFARGGMVPGQAKVGGDSFMNDRIVALLSPGEAVISRSMMDNPAISALVEAIVSGQFKPPAYGFGGAVGGAISSAGGAISGAAKDAGGVISDTWKDTVEFLQTLDPAKLWEMLKDKGMKSLWDMLQNAKFHDGGLITGNGEVPILGQAGEFVVNRSAVAGLGMGAMNAINSGRMPSGGNTYTYNVSIKVDAKTAPDEKFIRGTMVPLIKEELRRSSLDGQTVVYKGGIR